MAENKSLIPIERIEQSILLIRGHKIMLDGDLATLYGVSTKVLNQAVKRHRDRFPEDFMFQLTMEEAKTWWSEIVETRFKVTICDLKTTRPTHQIPPLCIYGTRNPDALQCIE